MVNAHTTSAVVAKGTSKPVSEHPVYLENLARQKAPTVSMQESMKKRYNAAYSTGKRWNELVGWFGGVGCLLIFVTVGG